MLVGVPLAAAACLAIDCWRPHENLTSEAGFQRLVLGLGTGPANSLEFGPRSYDARLGLFRQGDIGPLPAGGWFVPNDSLSVLPLDEDTLRRDAAEPNGLAPTEHDAQLR